MISRPPSRARIIAPKFPPSVPPSSARCSPAVRSACLLPCCEAFTLAIVTTLTAWQVDPSQRPSAAEMVTVLEDLLQRSSSSVEPVVKQAGPLPSDKDPIGLPETDETRKSDS